jgi:hypothetical protein
VSFERRACPTANHGQRAIVLLVAGTPRLAERCAQAASGGLAGIVECELAETATQAARWRPFAIVVIEDVYAFDRGEFEALARDVGARLVVVPNDDTPADALSAKLRAAATGGELTS